jgi:hypothetical protein
MEHWKISNPKHQIPIFNDKGRFEILNFGSAFGGLFVLNL